MKKLTIAAAIVVCACSVQAASFRWGFTGAASSQDANGDYLGEKVTPVAYLYLGTVDSSKTAFIFGTAVQLATVTGFDSEWRLGSPDVSVESDSLASTTAGQSFTLIMLEDNGKSISNYEGNYILVSGLVSGQGVNPMDETDTWATFTNATEFTASSWQSMTASVPEPTSGLLLLIGMAGLALKRKRA